MPIVTTNSVCASPANGTSATATSPTSTTTAMSTVSTNIPSARHCAGSRRNGRRSTYRPVQQRRRQPYAGGQAALHHRPHRRAGLSAGIGGHRARSTAIESQHDCLVQQGFELLRRRDVASRPDRRQCVSADQSRRPAVGAELGLYNLTAGPNTLPAGYQIRRAHARSITDVPARLAVAGQFPVVQMAAERHASGSIARWCLATTATATYSQESYNNIAGSDAADQHQLHADRAGA